jgi:hypothetical protein
MGAYGTFLFMVVFMMGKGRVVCRGFWGFLLAFFGSCPFYHLLKAKTMPRIYQLGGALSSFC